MKSSDSHSRLLALCGLPALFALFGLILLPLLEQEAGIEIGPPEVAPAREVLDEAPPLLGSNPVVSAVASSAASSRTPAPLPTWSIARLGQDLSVEFDSDGAHVHGFREEGASPSWGWRYRLERVGREARLEPVAEEAPQFRESLGRVEFQRRGLTEYYQQRPEGVEQGFELHKRPAGEGEVVLEGQVDFRTELGTPIVHGREDSEGITFATRDAGVLRYSKLIVWDATGARVPARLSWESLPSGGLLAIRLDDTKAVYPIHVDPLLTTPSWTAESNQAGGALGNTVSSAGDVNGDGYADVIVGAPGFDEPGISDAGRAYVYLGSAGGLATSPAWSVAGTAVLAKFGRGVAGVGDVNGDGFGDVVVGAPGHNLLGRVYLYLGSASGLSTTSAWEAGTGTLQLGSQFGTTVAGAGDVNGDGFADVLVSAEQYDNGESNEGRAYLFLGSATGPAAAASWTAEGDQVEAQFGWALGGAGDVNGDGFDDVVIGVPWYDNGQLNEGRAYVYLGGAGGLALTPAWTAENDEASSNFGWSVAGAGDVNGDGFADVVTGAHNYDGGLTNQGQARVYFGSAAGPATTPSWTFAGGVNGASLGEMVAAAGDVNGDGFGDLALASPRWTNGQLEEGRVLVFEGQASGLPSVPTWTHESNQASAFFGGGLASAGDVDGDGFGDLLVGAPAFDNGESQEGRAFLFLGKPGTPTLNAAWTYDGGGANARLGQVVADGGDVNGDGYSDFLVTSPGQGGAHRVDLFFGGPTGPAGTPDWSEVGVAFGLYALGVGDVNGDGFGDVVIGVTSFTNGETNEGKASLHLGGPTGLAALPAWVIEGNSVGAFLGNVAAPGDVNGDGLADVVIAAPYFTGGFPSRGRADLYLGTPTGLSATPTWTAYGDGTAGFFGWSLASGDVNGDGYPDVLVGASNHAMAGEGKVFLYLGGAAGLGTTPARTFSNGQAGSEFGTSLAVPGDVNGDGYDDFVTAASQYQNGETSEGRVFLFLGSATGPAATPAWTTESNQVGATMQYVGGGDVNGDGYADVFVGAWRYTNGQSGEGQCRIHLGGASGPSVVPDWSAESNQAFASAGPIASVDVNADGFADVLMGAPSYRNPLTNQGRVFLFYGSGQLGRPLLPGQRQVDDSAQIAPGGTSVTDGVLMTIRGVSSWGRTRVKLEWEIKESGKPFDGTGLGRSSLFVDTGTSGTVMIRGTATGLTLAQGYRWRARLVDRAIRRGRWTRIRPRDASRDFRVTSLDTTPPVAGSVSDGLGADSSLQASVTTLSANWSGFSDLGTGIASYAWALGTSAGAANLQPFQSVGLATSATRSGLGLVTGVTYFVTVRATDGAGLSVSASSNGVLVDATPPVAGTVNDGPAADLGVIPSSGLVEANWSGFADPESGIVDYSWAIGTSPGAEDIQPLAFVGNATSASGVFALSSGVTYYVTVQATNRVGLSVRASSNGASLEQGASLLPSPGPSSPTNPPKKKDKKSSFEKVSSSGGVWFPGGVAKCSLGPPGDEESSTGWPWLLLLGLLLARRRRACSL